MVLTSPYKHAITYRSESFWFRIDAGMLWHVLRFTNPKSDPKLENPNFVRFKLGLSLSLNSSAISIIYLV